MPTDIRSKIESYLNPVAGDWYRYARQNYVLWTDKDLASLTEEITKLPGLGNFYVLATEFFPAQCNGMMPKHFWEWLQKPRP
jgi:hypothetical protein